MIETCAAEVLYLLQQHAMCVSFSNAFPQRELLL